MGEEGGGVGDGVGGTRTDGYTHDHDHDNHVDTISLSRRLHTCSLESKKQGQWRLLMDSAL